MAGGLWREATQPALNQPGASPAESGFPGHRGVSAGNHTQDFAPAFLDTDTGMIYLARYADGRPAPLHVLEGLPPELLISRDADGRVTGIKPSVIVGFVRTGTFYMHEQATHCA